MIEQFVGSDSNGDLNTDDKILYAFWALRTFIYVFYSIIIAGQVYHEIVASIAKQSVTTRFLVYFTEGMFCLFRVAGDIMHYIYPQEYHVDSWWHFCFHWGNFFVIVAWVFIEEFWLKLMYTFFVHAEIQLQNALRVRIFCAICIIIYFIWSVIVSILLLATKKDYSILEAIGFVVFLVCLAISVAINGVGFVRMAQKSAPQNSPSFRNTIKRSKIFIAMAIIVVCIALSNDMVFKLHGYFGQYKFFVAFVVISMFNDVGQMTTILILLASGGLKNYVLFKKTSNNTNFNTVSPMVPISKTSCSESMVSGVGTETSTSTPNGDV